MIKEWIQRGLGWAGICMVAGCAAAAPDAAEAARPLEESLRAAGNSTYFSVRQDVRRCASPLCGGYFVKRVNRPNTVCADGSRQAECYVAELDLTALGLNPTQDGDLRGAPREFLLRGSIAPKVYPSFGNLGVFQASEAWRGHAGVVPDGKFYRAASSGIVCITFPCPSYSAELLNYDRDPLSVAAIDLEGISKDTSDAVAQLSAAEGLLIAAQQTRVKGPAGSAIGLDASEYYLPYRAQQLACGSRGLPECPAGTYCQFPADSQCGATDRGGRCTSIPEFCTKEYRPVCGCDGQTYGNACEAAAAGVSVAAQGACGGEEGAVCGTIVGLSCESGQYCDFGVGQCQVADAAGVCRTRPELCPQIFAPVCGCDGKTYPNSCEAARAGAQVNHLDACP